MPWKHVGGVTASHALTHHFGLQQLSFEVGEGHQLAAKRLRRDGYGQLGGQELPLFEVPILPSAS